jgi:hypothetical protein
VSQKNEVKAINKLSQSYLKKAIKDEVKDNVLGVTFFILFS